MIHQVDHSVNFFLYCVSSKVVRVEFLIMMGWHKRERARNVPNKTVKSQQKPRIKHIGHNDEKCLVYVLDGSTHDLDKTTDACTLDETDI